MYQSTRDASVCWLQKGQLFPLATHVVTRVQHIKDELPAPERQLPAELQAAICGALTQNDLNFEADYAF